MFAVDSISGKTIRLPDERWVHIVERHPEMAGHLEEVLLAVATPDFVLKGGDDELLAVMPLSENKWLVAVYKENSADGFVITAYITGKTEKLFKREILWQK